MIHARFIPQAEETPDGSDFRKQYVVVKQSRGTCASVGIAALYVADKISQDGSSKTFRIKGVKVE